MNQGQINNSERIHSQRCAVEVSSWPWPAPMTNSMPVFDKYSGESRTLNINDETWEVVAQGQCRQFTFQDGEVGRLQRQLCAATQHMLATPTIAKFIRALTANWGAIVIMLADGPLQIDEWWDVLAPDEETAKTGKTILRYAAQCRVGPWHEKHLDLIRALSNRNEVSSKSQKARIRNRSTMLSIDMQADIVSALNLAAERASMPDLDLEAMVALALIYEHAVRPVQILALKISDIAIVLDANNERQVMISFHAAKQRRNKSFVVTRVMKPSWNILLCRLVENGEQESSRRLFSTTAAQVLWQRVKRSCKLLGYPIRSGFSQIRHNGAQVLADTGHGMKLISRYLMQSQERSAAVYVEASAQQAELINRALGVSRLYSTILGIARGDLVTTDELTEAPESMQVGGVLGTRMISSIGLCKSGQPSCPFDPVSGCYGCSRFMPSDNLGAHKEAVTGMREQVAAFVALDTEFNSPAALQLVAALSKAQQTIALIQEGLDS